MFTPVFIILFALFVAAVSGLFFLLANSVNKNEQLENTIKELEEKNENLRKDFISKISHELRTPINTINGMSEIVLQEKLSPEVTESISSIQVTGVELLSKINDIIDYTHIRSGHYSIDENTYNISSTLNDVLSNYTNAAYDKGIEILVDCDPTIPSELIGDEPKIRRVMMNLLGNAIKFTNTGSITITLSARIESYGINLHFAVRDSGIGMSRHDIDQIYEGFYQVGDGTKRSAGGIGLGLSISYVIVKSMGGFLTIDSAPGVGTTVAFTVPQKILSSTPIASVPNSKSINVACYLDLENLNLQKIRDDFVTCTTNAAKGLNIGFVQYFSINDLKAAIDEKKVTHILVGRTEYLSNRDYFKSLKRTVSIIVTMSRDDESINDENVTMLYKPYYSIAIANILNDTANKGEYIGRKRRGVSFFAPDVRAMIVDDNLMNLKVAQGLLKKYKITSTIVASGQECLNLLTENSYDLIFMDHMMPEMDGVECLHRIRKRAENYFKELPVIALTANAVDNAREMYLSEGFTDFVAKPIDNLWLEHALLKAIPASKMISARDLPADSPLSVEKQTDTAEQVVTTVEKTANNETGPLIDREAALELFGGDEEMYQEMAEVYVEMATERLGVLKKLFEEKDYTNYCIEIHALKSTSRNIGAMKLGDLSEKLEKLTKKINAGEGSDDDIKVLEMDHPVVIEMLKAVLNELSEK